MIRWSAVANATARAVTASPTPTEIMYRRAGRIDEITATRNKYNTESEYRIPKLTKQLFHSLLTTQELVFTATDHARLLLQIPADSTLNPVARLDRHGISG